MNGAVSVLPEGPDDPFSLARAASAVLDERGRISGWSTRAQALLGYSAKEVLGRPARVLLDSVADLPGVLAEAAAAVARDGGWFGIVPVRHRNGHQVALGCRVRGLERPGGAQEWFTICAPADEVVQWEVDRSVMDGLFRRSPIGLSVHNPDLTIRRVNRAISRFSQVPPEQHRGRRVGDFLAPEGAEAVEGLLREVLETGKSAISNEQPYRLRRSPAHELMLSTSAFRVEDSAGRVLGVAQTVEDVTDRYRARAHLALVNEASARIGTTLDVPRTARELTGVAVPELADCAAVDLLEPVLLGEEPPPGCTGPLRRSAVRGVAPELERLMDPVGTVLPCPPHSPQARCLARRRAVLEVRAQGRSGWYGAGVPEGAAAGSEPHSLLVVPLRARGMVLGLLSLWRTRRPEPFEEEDLALAEELASRAAVCVDNSRRYSQQHQAALALQQSLLPREVPGHPAIEIAHRYLPADPSSGVGGDWFDVIPLSGLRTALVVGDVVGHGIHAAATMGRLRTAVQTLARLDLAPDELLTRLDDLVEQLAAEQDPADGGPVQVIGATCLYAVYDPVARRLVLASAGHLPPAVVHPDGMVTHQELPVGPPLGLGGLPFETTEIDVAEGSVIALYTDGLVEARQRDLDEGLARLRAALALPAGTLDDACDAITGTLLPERPADDVALLIARTRALPAELVAVWELPAQATAAGRARELAQRQLQLWGMPELGFSTELIVSELVTNAYRHAGGPVTLRLLRGDSLICEVSDPSSTSPHLRRARNTDEGGRGLFLVAQYAHRWGTRYSRAGKTIWAEQELPPAGRAPRFAAAG